MAIRGFEIFTAHPASVGETYLQHRKQAHWFAGRLLKASLACFVHGFLPFVFVKTASGIVMNLNHLMGFGRERSSLKWNDLNPESISRRYGR